MPHYPRCASDVAISESVEFGRLRMGCRLVAAEQRAPGDGAFRGNLMLPLRSAVAPRTERRPGHTPTSAFVDARGSSPLKCTAHAFRTQSDGWSDSDIAALVMYGTAPRPLPHRRTVWKCYMSFSPATALI